MSILFMSVHVHVRFAGYLFSFPCSDRLRVSVPLLLKQRNNARFLSGIFT